MTDQREWRALTVTQPWAAGVERFIKEWETRSCWLEGGDFSMTADHTPEMKCETCGLSHGEDHEYECICPNGHWGWVERAREKGYCYVCAIRWPEEALATGHPFKAAQPADDL